MSQFLSFINEILSKNNFVFYYWPIAYYQWHRQSFFQSNKQRIEKLKINLTVKSFIIYYRLYYKLLFIKYNYYLVS